MFNVWTEFIKYCQEPTHTIPKGELMLAVYLNEPQLLRLDHLSKCNYFCDTTKSKNPSILITYLLLVLCRLVHWSLVSSPICPSSPQLIPGDSLQTRRVPNKTYCSCLPPLHYCTSIVGGSWAPPLDLPWASCDVWDPSSSLSKDRSEPIPFQNRHL
jgi:hypothetical protein